MMSINVEDYRIFGYANPNPEGVLQGPLPREIALCDPRDAREYFSWIAVSRAYTDRPLCMKGIASIGVHAPDAEIIIK